MNVINEVGLYKLTFKSHKPEAKRFTRWVTHEVLPYVRVHGLASNQAGVCSLRSIDKGDVSNA